MPGRNFLTIFQRIYKSLKTLCSCFNDAIIPNLPLYVNNLYEKNIFSCFFTCFRRFSKSFLFILYKPTYFDISNLKFLQSQIISPEKSVLAFALASESSSPSANITAFASFAASISYVSFGLGPCVPKIT